MIGKESLGMEKDRMNVLNKGASARAAPVSTVYDLDSPQSSVMNSLQSLRVLKLVSKTAEIREALQHAIKVSREGSCQWPRPRVIPVRDVYPSPSTTYVPHCAILHRCSDDTGCCRSEALTCVPKHSNRVELSFYVKIGSLTVSYSFVKGAYVTPSVQLKLFTFSPPTSILPNQN
ncbi:hypothetical protein WN48_04969 [Eufriesea mexicana]|nr:hypothetical protein WN48_04969 [Eufriesea mexicana]